MTRYERNVLLEKMKELQDAFKFLDESTVKTLGCFKIFNESLAEYEELERKQREEFIRNVLEAEISCAQSLANELFPPNHEELLLNNVSKEETISSLKKRIKHCKNHMERKKLQQELNALYKERKNVRA